MIRHIILGSVVALFLAASFFQFSSANNYAKAAHSYERAAENYDNAVDSYNKRCLATEELPK